jgi:hypothetical protein
MESGIAHNQIPSSIVGIPGHCVEDVLVENVRIRAVGGGSRERAEIKLNALDAVPENAKDYPGFSMWGELPRGAFTCGTPRESRCAMFNLRWPRRISGRPLSRTMPGDSSWTKLRLALAGRTARGGAGFLGNKDRKLEVTCENL